MARSDRHLPPAPPRDALARLIEGVQTLFREHLALARFEVKDDIRRTGRSVLLSVAGLPPVFVGYVLLMIAIALLLRLVLADWAAFGIVALANLALGTGLTLAFAAKVRAEKLALARTAEELRRDREWLSSMRNGDEGTRESAALPMGAQGTGGIATSKPMDDRSRESVADRSRARNQSLPAGKAGNTADLAPRSTSPVPGQPVAGATSTPDGEPMIAQQGDAVSH
jgi:uncharacterized membrane protein YqjE